MMKAFVISKIEEFVKAYEEQGDITTKWGKPLVGFADVKHPLVSGLTQIVSASHQRPEDVLEGASVIIAYFVPFTRELNKTNREHNNVASREWALAYEETNAMFPKLNEYLISALAEKGVRAAVSPETLTFDRDKLISNWSHRHIARAAGLGTFGLNNMLITKQGCCGRYHSLITDLDVEPDAPIEEDHCLYKKNGSCGICVQRCPADALSFDGFERNKCYGAVRRNAEIHVGLGNSYSGDNNQSSGHDGSGSEVCGKCISFAPCAFFSTLL